MLKENFKESALKRQAADGAVAGGSLSHAKGQGARAAEVLGKSGFLYRLVLKICRGNKKVAEVLRFCIVGGVATVVDFLTMGVVLYLIDPSLYPNFFNVFYGGGTPTATASCIGTGAGFLVGLGVNYALSVLFVFDEKGSSRTLSGFVLFALLSAGGLAINVLGMYLLVDLAGLNEWVIKIVLTLVVLVYNYITRKLIIFKNRGGAQGKSVQSK